MQVVFVRHGESTSNVANEKGYWLFTGQLDCELTEKGRKQAEALRGDSIFENADAFFVSDLKRTVETASFFADPEKTVYDARLRERFLGELEGKDVNIIKNDPRYAALYTDPEFSVMRHGFTLKAPGGENYGDVCKRAQSFWDEIRTEGYQKIVIVSHVCTIRCLMRVMLGLSEEETLSLKVKNCTPMMIEV